jgi:hypothetical protein
MKKKYIAITKSTVYYPMTISSNLPYVISRLPLPVAVTRVDRVASAIYPL